MGSFRCCGDEIAVAWGPSQEPQQTRLGKEPLRLFGKGWSAGPGVWTRRCRQQGALLAIAVVFKGGEMQMASK